MTRRLSALRSPASDASARARERRPELVAPTTTPDAQETALALACVVVGVPGGDEPCVDVAHALSGWRGSARLSPLGGYVPNAGDRVLVVRADAQAFVTSVISCAAPPSLLAPDGARVRLVAGALELADPEGRLLVRYVDGHAEIAPPAGDLRLRAPAGRISLEAGSDVHISAARDVTLHAERAVEGRAGAEAVSAGSRLRLDLRRTVLGTPALEVRAKSTDVATGAATVVARDIRTSAERIATEAEELRITAGRVVERAREALYEVADLLETRAGRVRTLVHDLFSLRANRTALKSTSDTAIDGRRVLLG